MKQKTLFKEKYTTLGETITYTAGKNLLIGKTHERNHSGYGGVLHFWRQVLLPSGWPASVSDDYIPYQIWDSAQAFCSGITGILATRAVLVGVGVGNAESQAASATITWIMKDGTGMCGRILFAWWQGTGLDADCKKWRLFADFLNDLAMSLELVIPSVMYASTHLLCVATAMKALVGVAGGATRASITQHQALRGNTGDVSAKDGSQETFVNLCASMFGVLLMMTFPDGRYDWPLFLIFAIMHLFTNYKAVRALNMKTLNEARLLLVLNLFLNESKIGHPKFINDQESVILGSGLGAQDLCNFKIKMGGSLRNVSPEISLSDLETATAVFQGKFALITNLQRKTIHVLLETGEKSEDIILGYYSALYLGLALSYSNSISLKYINDLGEIPKTLKQIFDKETKAQSTLLNLHSLTLLEVQRIAYRDFQKFKNMLQTAGWTMENHQITVDEWRFTRSE